mgnify:CR=1 FL=1
MIGNKAALPNRRAALDSQQAQQDNLLCLFLYYFIIPCLALWERWLSAAKTER